MVNPTINSSVITVTLPLALVNFRYCFEIAAPTESLVFRHRDSHFIFAVRFGSLSMCMMH